MTRLWLVFAVVLAGEACVGAPNNDAPVATTATLVAFSGYDLTPGTLVRLQAAAQRSGTFVQFATTTTNSEPVTLKDGTKLYAWKVSAAVPASKWTPFCDGKETFVRARSAGGYSLYTYDGPGEGGAPSGVMCVVQKIADGMSTITAMATCASPDSPVIRLTTPSGGLPKVHRGNVIVNTQAEADVYACIEQLNGSLTIGAGSNELSIALPALQTISGDLNLTWLRDPADSPFLPEVRSIDLSSLASVGGALVGQYLGVAPLPLDYISFDMRLEALTSVGGPISLSLINTSNGDLQGFDSLLAHAGDITVLGGTGDGAWYSLFPVLNTVGGNVHVRLGHSTYGVMRQLTGIGGNLLVEDALLHTEALSGSFPLLSSVTGNLTFEDVGTTGGAAIVKALTSVGGQLSISGGGAQLENLALGAPAGVDLHGLALVDNASLASWTNTNWHLVGSGPAAIVDNPSLPACAPETFVATQEASGWTGSATLAGNTVCP